ncbi:hypothetical protein HOLleu_31033 [Holothuria leucospilota]|uniref:Uncharacterized protein n=1 Tax=Holothuria leucospilota TaxID=206669 RepID=A0A9Q1BL88_HOLLE|nr:hypothetical protein HOLleu_31033 [Holothuria leucospilota]
MEASVERESNHVGIKEWRRNGWLRGMGREKERGLRPWTPTGAFSLDHQGSYGMIGGETLLLIVLRLRTHLPISGSVTSQAYKGFLEHFLSHCY